MDYYNILGVNKTASPDEIKQAYRKLAMQHHPDKGGNEKTFQQINEAYDTLKDPAKRQQYDNPAPRNDFNFRANNFEDIFGTFFKQGMQQRPRKNRDVRLQVTITLEDVLNGKNLVAEYVLPSGQNVSANLHLHPGVEHGQAIRFKGLGDNSIPQLEKGDLILVIQIQKHPVFHREGMNLIVKKEINALDLLYGTTIDVKTLKGNTVRVTIPQGTQPNTLMSISDHGLVDQRTGKTGRLFLEIKCIIPKIKDENILKRIKDLNDEISHST